MLRKLLTRATLGAAILCGTAALAYAQGDLRSDRATYFTFSKPVALPTGTIPAGKYLFRIADSQTTRSVVQVYTEDGAKLIGMMLTMPAIRNRVSDEPEVRFLEGPENAPPAIATWWYPGMKTGWEFIYPREQAMKLAQSSKQPVLTTARQVTADEMKTADLVRVTGSEQTPVTGEPAATTPSGQTQRGEIAKGTSPQTTPPSATPRPATPEPRTPPQTTTARPVTPEPPARTPQTAPAPQPAPSTPTTATAPRSAPDRGTRSELPQTASATPLVGVIGALALGAGLALGVWRRRTA